MLPSYLDSRPSVWVGPGARPLGSSRHVQRELVETTPDVKHIHDEQAFDVCRAVNVFVHTLKAGRNRENETPGRRRHC